MDYKKIIKNRKLRIAILDFLAFIPDKMMLKIQYRIKLRRKLDLKGAKRYTERVQWLKLYYREPIMKRCVDKYDVREYIKEKGLEDILVDCYGVYSNPQEIDWDSLPQQFVMKKTNGGGGLNVYICKNKKNINMDEVEPLLFEWVKTNKAHSLGREWAYDGLPSRIVIDQYLENKDKPEAGISDYKFLCFDGKVKYIVLDVDRFTDHKRNIYDSQWNYINITTDHETYGDTIAKPKKLNEMIQIAERLSEDFPMVRVDLYLVQNKIYFGELTFYPWSGYVQFIPDNFDYELGKCWKDRGH